MIKYIGSKRNMTAVISAAVFSLETKGTVIDPFSGTARVGMVLKNLGYRVISADHNHYAYTLAVAHVQANLKDHDGSGPGSIRSHLDVMNNLNPVEGYFTETFCKKSRFFTPENGAKVDAARDYVEGLSVTEEQKRILVTSIMEAADKVDSTVGLQMAYLKSWSDRAKKDIVFTFPDMRSSHEKSIAVQGDVLGVLKQHPADVAYFDPPYNQHKYLGNYHIWETLSLWDKPESYGVAQKRIDCKTRSSDFNSKVKAASAIKKMLAATTAPHILLSYNNEGFVSFDELKEMLASVRKNVVVCGFDHKRHVGHKIGIHSPDGELVGEPSHGRTTEYLFIATDDDKAANRAKRGMAPYLLG